MNNKFSPIAFFIIIIPCLILGIDIIYLSQNITDLKEEDTIMLVKSININPRHEDKNFSYTIKTNLGSFKILNQTYQELSQDQDLINKNFETHIYKINNKDLCIHYLTINSKRYYIHNIITKENIVKNDYLTTQDPYYSQVPKIGVNLQYIKDQFSCKLSLGAKQ